MDESLLPLLFSEIIEIMRLCGVYVWKRIFSFPSKRTPREVFDIRCGAGEDAKKDMDEEDTMVPCRVMGYKKIRERRIPSPPPRFN